MNLRRLTIVLLAAQALAAAAAPAPGAAPSTAPPTLYVAPRQSVQLLSQPQPNAPSQGTVSTDEPLAQLAEQGEFVSVRTVGGTVGWVRRSALTSDEPRPPSALAADNARLTEQVGTLEAQVQAFQDENAQLRARMQSVEATLALHTRPVPLTAAGITGFVLRMLADPYAWAALGALLLALLVAFRAGIEHRNKGIRERLGGLDL
jgi:hypothetical protein